MKPTHILFAVQPKGYMVKVMAGSTVHEEYLAGNSRHDSLAFAPLESAGALTPEEVRWACQQTCTQMAAEHGIAPSLIERDDDLDAELIETIYGNPE